MSASSPGFCAFVHFEDDGATANIVTVSDILYRDEAPVLRLPDLRSGQDVLAKWSDGKFYKATVEYVGPTDQTKQKIKKTQKDTFLQALISSPASSGSEETAILEKSTVSNSRSTSGPSPGDAKGKGAKAATATPPNRSTPGPSPGDAKGNGAKAATATPPNKSTPGPSPGDAKRNRAKATATPPNGAEVARTTPPSNVDKSVYAGYCFGG